MELKKELVLYTQTFCGYCDVMKAKLNEWGVPYTVANIEEDNEAKAFIVLDEGHKTVPQLYYGSFNINRGINTEEYTEEMFRETIERIDG
jgi:glutaredoxin